MPSGRTLFLSSPPLHLPAHFLTPFRLVLLLALLIALCPASAQAQCGVTYNCVSAFTLAPSSLTSGSQQFASGSITVQRVPGSTGSIAVSISGSDLIELQCADGNTTSFKGCYVPGDSTTFKLWATGVVSAPETNNIKARVEYSSDIGITQPLTRIPFEVTLTVTPTVITYGFANGAYLEEAAGTMHLNHPVRGGQDRFLRQLSLGVCVSLPGFQVDSRRGPGRHLQGASVLSGQFKPACAGQGMDWLDLRLGRSDGRSA